MSDEHVSPWRNAFGFLVAAGEIALVFLAVALVVWLVRGLVRLARPRRHPAP